MTTSSVNIAAQRTGSRRLASLAPWFSRLFLGLPALVMTLVSVRYITNPMHAASPTGVMLSTPEALTDTRVVGALVLTVVFALGGCLVSVRRLRMGHVLVIALMGFILAVRFFGFTQDGTTLATGDQKVKTIGETVFLLVNVIGFFLQTYVVKPAREGQ